MTEEIKVISKGPRFAEVVLRRTNRYGKTRTTTLHLEHVSGDTWTTRRPSRGRGGCGRGFLDVREKPRLAALIPQPRQFVIGAPTQAKSKKRNGRISK